MQNKETQVARTQSGSSSHSKWSESDDSRDKEWDINEDERKKRPKLGVR